MTEEIKVEPVESKVDKIKVIFLDFDGVLNSEASFLYEGRLRKAKATRQIKKGRVCETLCHVCTSNFQHILDRMPHVKIVISSTWRELFDLEWLKAKLEEYGIDSSRVIDKTPSTVGYFRGREIRQWLDMHPEVTDFVVIDDNAIEGGEIPEEKIVKTTWPTGLTLIKAVEVLQSFGVKNPEQGLFL